MATKKTAKQPESFEAALTQLEQIVQQLERGELPLEEALASFKEGIELSQYCQKTLTEAEQTVAKMMTPQGEVNLDAEEI
ncbi:exodeoxyribonuclease VII small subunit [Globicatella sulfidifaciens]|uniref:exodeoxyribonuclease VII small subunit n=1 Tax=Globicatella sulfidifaciens TaxID=136093 RepID=UPI0023F0A46A|nr:exodeoxyribonuclease VII small subunit [Globicatella sulfidifaciens]MDT2767867.1 exodeoxyribonuclease VII small subunit [Globicatella sulfidifaciens]